MARRQDYKLPESHGAVARYTARVAPDGGVESSFVFLHRNWLGDREPTLEAGVRTHMARVLWKTTRLEEVPLGLLDQHIEQLTLEVDSVGDPLFHCVPRGPEQGAVLTFRELLLTSARDVYRGRN